jgi:hypothetical protein
VIPPRRVPGQLRLPSGPPRRDGPEPDGWDRVLRPRHVVPRWLQVGDGHLTVSIGRRVRAHPRGVGGHRAAARALVAQRHLREARRLAELPVLRPGAVGVHLDRLVHVADDHPHRQRRDRLFPRRMGVAHQEHVRARLEGHEIARGVQAPVLVVVPVIVDLVGRVLLVGERGRGGEQRVRGLADDRQDEDPGPGLPEERCHAEWSCRDELHHHVLTPPTPSPPPAVCSASIVFTQPASSSMATLRAPRVPSNGSRRQRSPRPSVPTTPR